MVMFIACCAGPDPQFHRISGNDLAARDCDIKSVTRIIVTGMVRFLPVIVKIPVQEKIPAHVFCVRRIRNTQLKIAACDRAGGNIGSVQFNQASRRPESDFHSPGVFIRKFFEIRISFIVIQLDRIPVLVQFKEMGASEDLDGPGIAFRESARHAFPVVAPEIFFPAVFISPDDFHPVRAGSKEACANFFLGQRFCLVHGQLNLAVRNSAGGNKEADRIIRFTPAFPVRAGASADDILTLRQLGGVHGNRRTVTDRVRLVAVPVPVDIPGVHPVIFRTVSGGESEHGILSAFHSHGGLTGETVAADLIIPDFNPHNPGLEPVFRIVYPRQGIDRNLPADILLVVEIGPEESPAFPVKPVIMVFMIDDFTVFSAPPASRTVELCGFQRMAFRRADQELNIGMHRHRPFAVYVIEIPFAHSQQHKIGRCTVDHRNAQVKVRAFISACFRIKADAQRLARFKRSPDMDCQLLFPCVIPEQIVVFPLKPDRRFDCFRVFRFFHCEGNLRVFGRCQRSRKLRRRQRQGSVICRNGDGNRVRPPLVLYLPFISVLIEIPDLMAFFIQCRTTGFDFDLVCAGPAVGMIPGSALPVVAVSPVAVIAVIPVHFHPFCTGRISRNPEIFTGFHMIGCHTDQDTAVRNLRFCDSKRFSNHILGAVIPCSFRASAQPVGAGFHLHRIQGRGPAVVLIMDEQVCQMDDIFPVVPVFIPAVRIHPVMLCVFTLRIGNFNRFSAFGIVIVNRRGKRSRFAQSVALKNQHC